MSESQTVTFTNSGTVRSMIPTKPLDLDFQPDTVVLKQFVFRTGPIANGNMYFLWCSLTQSYIATLYYIDGSVTIEPMASFPITSWPVQDISFRIEYAYPAGFISGVNADWAITLEFSRGKKAEYFISKD